MNVSNNLSNPNVSKVLIDLDGVIFNFVNSVLTIYGLDPDKYTEYMLKWASELPCEYDIACVINVFARNKRNFFPPNYQLMLSKLTAKQMWCDIDERSHDFWSTLQPYPWASDLIKVCVQYFGVDNLYFCTSPSTHHHSASGKVQALRRFLVEHHPEIKHRQYVLTPHKHLCANFRHVLIDDSDDKCAEFILAGGHAILFPQPWNQACGQFRLSRRQDFPQRFLIDCVETQIIQFLNRTSLSN